MKAKASSRNSTRRFHFPAFLATFGILIILWFVLSGHFDLFHVSAGFLCSGLIAFLSHDLLFHDLHWRLGGGHVLRFIGYLPWLFYQIVLANLHVAKMVLHPKMPIDPRIIEFRTKLKSELAVTTMGTSITLTPGTITADVSDGKFCVHALTQKVTDDLLSGEMENRIAAIYREAGTIEK